VERTQPVPHPCSSAARSTDSYSVRGQSGDTIPILLSSAYATACENIVVPGRAHHVTQRGNWREAIFFEEGDQAICLDLLARQTARYEVQLWAYCLMPNHVHLILVPPHADAFGLAVGEAHKRYTKFINARGR
jgi:hypothetical protein